MSGKMNCEDYDYFIPSSGPGTSEEAAESMQGCARQLRARVLDYITAHGADGCTDQEIQEGLSMDSNTSRPRRWELYREGRIEKLAEKRRTHSGRLADVWVSKGNKNED
jgi:transcription initiation factor IIE alpha subunit